MTATVMKASLQKLRPIVVHYRKYKNFCNQSFRDKLVSELLKENFGINSSKLFISTSKKYNDHLSIIATQKFCKHNFFVLFPSCRKELFFE